MSEYFFRSSVKQTAASLYWCTLSHLEALLLLRAPHFLCLLIFVFNTYISCIPTASQVRITAEILCGSKTFSSTTVRLFCRLSRTFLIRSSLSGVIFFDWRLALIFALVNYSISKV